MKMKRIIIAINIIRRVGLRPTFFIGGGYGGVEGHNPGFREGK